MRLLIICCIAFVVAVVGEEEQLGNDFVPFEFDVRSKNGDYQIRATVDASDMPVTWQVEAAEDLKLAFELEDTTYKRLEMLSKLFGDSRPDYNWQVVLNYKAIYYYRASYYIQFKMEDDVVLLFARLKKCSGCQ